MTRTIATESPEPNAKPHILLLLPRGEAIRNFIYSDTLPELLKSSRVSILSVVDKQTIGDDYLAPVSYFGTLTEQPIPHVVRLLRSIIDQAHFKYIATAVGREHWDRLSFGSTTTTVALRHLCLKLVSSAAASDTCLRLLTRLEHVLHDRLQDPLHFHTLLSQLKPDLVFNCSHIHGPAAETPLRIAHHLGIKTAGFIFSWDNLYSRGRILSPYDHVLVWHGQMKSTFLSQYPAYSPERIHITGTPQFDYHFKPKYHLSREDLCARIGLDPTRPYILYTTGIAHHFPEEHHHVSSLISTLKSIPHHLRPQLVVRLYAKGNSPEMLSLSRSNIPDVFFPPIEWDSKWFTPALSDLTVYTNLLRHCALGINVASTVSLELMIHNKPVLNLGFDPPSSTLHRYQHYARHLAFDHYLPLITSGAAIAASSSSELASLLQQCLNDSRATSQQQKQFLQSTFSNTLDGMSGRRVAQTLLKLASQRPHATYPLE